MYFAEIVILPSIFFFTKDQSCWLIIYAKTTLIWNSTAQFCNARSNFDKCHYINCLRAEFAAKHTKAPLSFIMRWRMESDFG